MLLGPQNVKRSIRLKIIRKKIRITIAKIVIVSYIIRAANIMHKDRSLARRHSFLRGELRQFWDQMNSA